MYKIGDFSNMSKTTIKALRYYEKEGLLKPVYVDSNTGYRYYETSQLIDISKIISLRQIRLSIKDIKCILDGEYKESNIKIRYAQAVEKEGKETDKVKFMKLDPTTALCIYHKGCYENLRD